MELRTAIETRASVRHFAEGDIPVSDLREMVRLAGLAPSANNSQPWRFIAVTNRDLLRGMADAVREKIGEMLPDSPDEAKKKAKSQVEWFSTFFADAPAVFAVAGCPYRAVIDDALPPELTHEEMNALRRHPDIQSIGASIQNLLLAAVDMGYGGCWMSGPLLARDDLERLLGLASPWSLAALVAVGRPGGAVKPREKKPVDEIFELRS
jgi:nitroreductase